MLSSILMPAGAAVVHRISKIRWIPVRHWFDLRRGMRLRVKVRDPVDGLSYRFVADSLQAYQRARNLLSKEPETIAWLRRNLRPSDVFLDIGANVGTFSVFAAKHVSEEGHVYACEPHLPTTVQLLQNVAVNGLERKLSVISIAASSEDGFVPFRYQRWSQGASGSQLWVNGGAALRQCVGTELKSGLRVDTMIAHRVIRSPSLIKIDTDGLELEILLGMKSLLLSAERPRSILVEVQPGELRKHVDFMSTCRYTMVESHLIDRPRQMLERKHSLEDVVFNAVFEPGA